MLTYYKLRYPQVHTPVGISTTNKVRIILHLFHTQPEESQSVASELGDYIVAGGVLKLEFRGYFI